MLTFHMSVGRFMVTQVVASLSLQRVGNLTTAIRAGSGRQRCGFEGLFTLLVLSGSMSDGRFYCFSTAWGMTAQRSEQEAACNGVGSEWLFAYRDLVVKFGTMLRHLRDPSYLFCIQETLSVDVPLKCRSS